MRRNAFTGKGNPELPIAQYKEEIVGAVEDNDCVIITAETGAGKSTQVPQYLLEAGYKVVVTEPRRLAVRTVSERVAEEYGVRFGELVGYRTGDSRDRRDSKETRLLFCTDGLQLVRELTGFGKAQILVIDEVHEWNINIETLVAWARKRLADGDAQFKVVIMSATLESQKLAEFFGGAPVIDVPGRMFPVEMSETHSVLSAEVMELVEKGKNVLVFQPGKSEIETTISELQGGEMVVLPLHGQLTPEEQKKCFQHYDVPKVVVATNVAQTSITVDDIDAVVDSGTERRVELVDGIEGLYLKSVSQADIKQRSGRAGRTKDGAYILCSNVSLEERPEFPRAEIERSRLDQLVLRLSVTGFDATELKFFHQPDPEALKDAKACLTHLGALDQEGNVTDTGRLMSRLPVDVHIARMVIEASKRGVVSDVIDIAACMEVGGVKDRTGKARSLTQESSSDLLAELEIFHKAQTIKPEQGQKRGEMLKEAGIFAKSFFKAIEMRRRLQESLSRFVPMGTTGNKQEILKSCVAGMVDHLFERQYDGYRNGGNGTRQVDRNSFVSSSGHQWVIGLPWDLEIQGKRGRMTLNLINWVSAVEPEWLVELAPQLSGSFLRNYRYNSDNDTVRAEKVTTFNEAEISTEMISIEGESPEAVRAFAKALVDGDVELPCVEFNKAKRAEVKSLAVRSKKVSEISQSQFTDWYVSKLGSAYIKFYAQGINLNLTDSDISEILEINFPTERQEIQKSCPDEIGIGGYNFAVAYERSYSSEECIAKVEVIEEFARQTSVETVKLPGGLNVILRCEGLEAESFPELVEKLEEKRIQDAWTEFRRQNEVTGFARENLLSNLSLISTSVEITKDSEGNSILGWFYIRHYYGTFSICLKETQEDAKEETSKALSLYMEIQTETILKVPNEESFQRSVGSYGSTELTELGRALKSGFEALRENFVAQDLTLKNISERVEAMKAEAEAVKTRVAGEYSEISSLISSTEAEISAKEEEIGDKMDFVEEEFEMASKSLSEAKGFFRESAYQQAREACVSAISAVAEVKELADKRVSCHKEAEEAVEQISSNLYDIDNGVGKYNYSVSKGYSNRAYEFNSELRQLLQSRKYDAVLEKVSEAENLVKEVNEVLDAWHEINRLVAEHIDRNYTNFSIVEVSADLIGSYASITDYDPAFSAVKSAIEEGGDEYKKFMESKLDGQPIVWLEACVYNSHTIEFYIHTSEGLALTELEMNEVEVTELWTPPDAEQLEKLRQLKALEDQLKEIDEQIERCEGNYASRAWLVFELDQERGTLFAMSSIPETGFSFKDDWKNISGTVRFVCDPKRCGWLDDAPPEAGEAWICSFNKMIGYDKKKRPIIIANPQTRDDTDRLNEEIVKLEKEIYGDAPEEELNDCLSTTTLEELEVDEESKDSLGANMLKLFQQKGDE